MLTEARNKIVEDARLRLRDISQRYVDGKLTLVEWQLEFRDTLRAAHTLSAGIARGGKANMTPADWGKVGAQLKKEYAALQRFALQLEQGRAMHLGRVDLYARAVRNTFLEAEKLGMPQFQLARWIRTRVESCEDCRTQAARGVALASTFPPFGSTQCRSNCGCYLHYVAKKTPEKDRLPQPGLVLPEALRERILSAPPFVNAAGHKEPDKVAAQSLGLSFRNAFPPGLSNQERRLDVPIDRLSIGRDALNRDRLLSVAEALRGGVRAKGKGVLPILVAQNPDGSFVVQGDGNHRIAALKLMGYRGNVPVKARLQKRRK